MKNVPSIDLFDENNDPHTNYIAIKWNSNPSAQEISACKSRMYGLDRNRYMDYLTRKPEFYDMMRVADRVFPLCPATIDEYRRRSDFYFTM